MASVTGVGNSSTSQSLVVDGLENPANTYTKIRIINQTTGAARDVNSGSSTTSAVATFSGLTPNTAYQYYAETTWGGGNRRIPSSGTVQYTTLAPVASPGPLLMYGSFSGLTATIEITTGANTHSIDFQTSFQPDSNAAHASNTTKTYTFTVPNYNTFYSISARARNNNGEVTSWYSYPFTTGDAKPSALNWATKIPGTEFSLLASSWNTMTARVNEWREYQGQSYILFSTAFSGYPLTAAMFNEVCSAIASLNPPIVGPQPVNSGDDVTAAKINRISDSIDSLI